MKTRFEVKKDGKRIRIYDNTDQEYISKNLKSIKVADKLCADLNNMTQMKTAEEVLNPNWNNYKLNGKSFKTIAVEAMEEYKDQHIKPLVEALEKIKQEALYPTDFSGLCYRMIVYRIILQCGQKKLILVKSQSGTGCLKTRSYTTNQLKMLKVNLACGSISYERFNC